LKVDAGERLSPHGMRAGFITEAYLQRGAGRAGDGACPAEKRRDDTALSQPGETIAGSPTKLLDL
jgi:hypothetical protein